MRINRMIRQKNTARKKQVIPNRFTLALALADRKLLRLLLFSTNVQQYPTTNNNTISNTSGLMPAKVRK